mgnify:FL=1
MNSGIKRAVCAVGGQTRLADLVGVTQQSVSLWCVQGYVPLSRVTAVEAVTGVPRDELVSPRVLNLTQGQRVAL